MKVLFLSPWYPFPADNGSRIRIYNLIKRLANHHQVDLISFAQEPVSKTQLDAMRTYCRKVEVVPQKSFDPSHSRSLMGFLSTLPRSVVATYSLEMERRVAASARHTRYDVVIASQLGTAPYFKAARTSARIIEEVELTTLFEQFALQRNPIKRLRHRFMWGKWVRYAAGLLSTSDGCTVVSEGESQHIRRISPFHRVDGCLEPGEAANCRPIGVVPNGVDVAAHQGDYGDPQPGSLVYAGALTYQANYDAMQYFLRDIYPLLQSNYPEIRLAITGRLDDVPLYRLPQRAGVEFTGYLPDVRPLVARSWVSVVPLRLGGGTRLKVLESLALGTPVVSTAKGIEGLDLVPGRDLLVADSPHEFAACVQQLLNDPDLRHKLSQNGRQSVAEHYDWSTIGGIFCDFVDDVVWGRVH